MDFVDFGLFLMYFLLVVSILGALVVFPVKAIIDSPKSFTKSLYFLGGLLGIFLISWAISGSEVDPKWAVLGENATSSKLIGGSLITFYIFMAAAVIGIIYSEINKVLK